MRVAAPGWQVPILVFIGGVLGTGGRLALHSLGDTAGLIVANTLACFVLAALVAWASRTASPRATAIKLLVGTGLCGSLSTQSTLALLSVQSGASGVAVTVVSLIVGFSAVATGWVVGSALTPAPRSQ